MSARFGWALAAIGLGCNGSADTLVGATLDDGQVLVGSVTTDTLTLDGPLGTVAVPLADVGMVVPVEHRTLADSHGHVTVWLRDGSELRGRWTAPELALDLTLGGAVVDVDVPTERLQSIQLRGGESWPSQDNFRVRTVWGDDFLVDPAKTRFTVASDLGTFELTLAECLYVGPNGEPGGAWRVVLATGTVLVGKPEDALRFVPSMGPEALVVPVESIVSLQHGGWNSPPADLEPEVTAAPDPGVVLMPPAAAAPTPAVDLVVGGDVDSDAAAANAPRAAIAAAQPGLAGSAGWFDNSRLYDAKH